MSHQFPTKCFTILLLCSSVCCAQETSKKNRRRDDIWEQHMRILREVDRQEALFAQRSGLPMAWDETGAWPQKLTDFVAKKRLPKWYAWSQSSSNGSSFRYEGDELVRESKQDDLRITVRGKVRGPEWIVSEIEIKQGKPRETFADRDEVPAKYQKSVDRLINLGVPAVWPS